MGIKAVRPALIAQLWRTGPVQATVMSVTFVLTLVIPLQFAVLVGVALAIVMHVVRQANRVRLVRWVFEEGAAAPIEEPPPAVLRRNETVVIVPYGSLFFAAASASPRFAGKLVSLLDDPTPFESVTSEDGAKALITEFAGEPADEVVARFRPAGRFERSQLLQSAA